MTPGGPSVVGTMAGAFVVLGAGIGDTSIGAGVKSAMEGAALGSGAAGIVVLVAVAGVKNAAVLL